MLVSYRCCIKPSIAPERYSRLLRHLGEFTQPFDVQAAARQGLAEVVLVWVGRPAFTLLVSERILFRRFLRIATMVRIISSQK